MTRKKSVKHRIDEIVQLKQQGEKNKNIAQRLDVSVETIRTAYKRYLAKVAAGPKIKVDRSMFAGNIGDQLRRIVTEKPWLTNQQLSDAIIPFSTEEKEAVRRFLIRNGISRAELQEKLRKIQ